MSERELIILGAGGHAAVVAETAMRAGWRVIAVASREEPMAGGPFAGARWIGDPDSEAGRAQIMASASRGAMLHAAVGDAATCAARVNDQFAQGADGVILHASTPAQLTPVVAAYRSVRDDTRFAGRSTNPGR